MLTRHQITRRADDDGVDAAVVERDYVLAHVVAQLHRAKPEGGGRLVFKGGTALRFVHLGDYRYSADLDFTVIKGSADEARLSLAQAVAAAKEHAGLPALELTDTPPVALAYIGPLQVVRPRRVKLDLALDEYVESVDQGKIVEGVWDDLPEPVSFDVYPVDEIAAEKLRCVIQRVQCRDLYDLFRLTEDMEVSLAELRPLFEAKTRAKGLDPAMFAERLADRVDRYGSRWQSEMSEHLADPPRFDDVVRVTRRHLRAAGLL